MFLLFTENRANIGEARTFFRHEPPSMCFSALVHDRQAARTDAPNTLCTRMFTPNWEGKEWIEKQNESIMLNTEQRGTFPVPYGTFELTMCPQQFPIEFHALAFNFPWESLVLMTPTIISFLRNYRTIEIWRGKRKKKKEWRRLGPRKSRDEETWERGRKTRPCAPMAATDPYLPNSKWRPFGFSHEPHSQEFADPSPTTFRRKILFRYFKRYDLLSFSFF